MLAELAAANAAFSIIKRAVQNTGEITSVISQVGDFTRAKTDLEKQLNKKKNRMFGGAADHDLEEFLALEAIKQNEEELKQAMIWGGRAGLWDDWVAHQGRARKERQAQQKEMEDMNRKILFNVGIGAIAMTLIGGIIGLIFFAGYLKDL